jgi:hypothetical protein
MVALGTPWSLSCRADLITCGGVSGAGKASLTVTLNDGDEEEEDGADCRQGVDVGCTSAREGGLICTSLSDDSAEVAVFIVERVKGQFETVVASSK